MHATLAQQSVGRKANSPEQPAENTRPIHLQQLQVVPPHHQVTANNRHQKRKGLCHSNAFFPETDGKKGHHNRCKVLNKYSRSHLDPADCIEVGNLHQRHQHASKQKEINNIL